MKKIFIIFLILIFASCAKNYEKFSFYDGNLKVITPKDWKLVIDNESKSIESPDNITSLSLTLFYKENEQFNDFMAYRYQAVDSKIWKTNNSTIDIESKYIFNYKTYEHTNGKYLYIVIPMANRKANKFLSLTFVIDKQNFDNYKNNISYIVKNIEL